LHCGWEQAWAAAAGFVVAFCPAASISSAADELMGQHLKLRHTLLQEEQHHKHVA
jgi:hypothetical protein